VSPCPALLTALLSDTERGLALARARIQSVPDDLTARFFLGKINLNYVWLQLGVLGRRTGWDEYWEARHSLDAVLARNPSDVRARVARAWIDYIVDTRMPFGTKWLLGGGNRKRALVTIQDAAKADADFFVHAEARFALWDLQIRERNVPAAVAVARRTRRGLPRKPRARQVSRRARSGRSPRRTLQKRMGRQRPRHRQSNGDLSPRHRRLRRRHEAFDYCEVRSLAEYRFSSAISLSADFGAGTAPVTMARFSSFFP
jgi:hypothetical protein